VIILKQTTLITGATSGIGKECAIEFAKHGFNLIIVARNDTKLSLLKKEIEANYNVSILVIVQDLFEEDAAIKLFNQLQEKNVIIDILINNAGFGDYNSFLESDWKRQENMLTLNIKMMIQMVYLFGNEMKKRGYGKILNLSSAVALAPGAYMSVYYATKAFVLSFSQALSEELMGTGVTVTALCPGPTATNFEKAGHMEESNLFKIFKNADAKDVAKFGYKATMQAKVIANYGIPTHLLNLGTHIVPKSILRKIMKIINGRPPIDK